MKSVNDISDSDIINNKMMAEEFSSPMTRSGITILPEAHPAFE
jgi:hypothetical protein